MKIKCSECRIKYNYDKNDVRRKQTNFMILCPNCYSILEVSSDEKSGKIVPCRIYKADELIGEILEENDRYILISDIFNIKQLLTADKHDLQCYEEAKEIIKNATKWNAMNYFDVP